MAAAVDPAGHIVASWQSSRGLVTASGTTRAGLDAPRRVPDPDAEGSPVVRVNGTGAAIVAYGALRKRRLRDGGCHRPSRSRRAVLDAARRAHRSSGDEGENRRRRGRRRIGGHRAAQRDAQRPRARRGGVQRLPRRARPNRRVWAGGLRRVGRCGACRGWDLAKRRGAVAPPAATARPTRRRWAWARRARRARTTSRRASGAELCSGRASCGPEAVPADRTAVPVVAGIAGSGRLAWRSREPSARCASACAATRRATRTPSSASYGQLSATAPVARRACETTLALQAARARASAGLRFTPRAASRRPRPSFRCGSSSPTRWATRASSADTCWCGSDASDTGALAPRRARRESPARPSGRSV